MAIIITITVVALLFSGVLGFFIYLWKAESGHHIESINAIEDELRSMRMSFETGIMQGQVPSDGAYNGKSGDSGNEEDDHRDEDPLAWARGEENPLAWVKSQENLTDKSEDAFREHDIIGGWEDGEDNLSEGGKEELSEDGEVNFEEVQGMEGSSNCIAFLDTGEDEDNISSPDEAVPAASMNLSKGTEYDSGYEGGSSIEPWPFGYNQIPDEEFDEIEDEIPSILLYENIPEDEFEPVAGSEAEDGNLREEGAGYILERDNLLDLELESTINEESGSGSMNIIGYDVGRSGKKYTSDELETLILE